MIDAGPMEKVFAFRFFGEALAILLWPYDVGATLSSRISLNEVRNGK